MIKQATLTLLLTLCALLTAVAQNREKNIKLGRFDQIQVLNNLTVEYTYDPNSEGEAYFDASNPNASQIMFDVNAKGQLTVQLDADAPKGELPVVHLSSNTLTSATNSGLGTLRLLRVPEVPYLRVHLSDNGKVELSQCKVDHLELSIITGRGVIEARGDVVRLTINNLGTGSIEALGVKASDIKCKIFGTGSIRVNGNDANLTVRGLGSGKVYYDGTPANVKVRGIGKVKAIPLSEK